MSIRVNTDSKLVEEIRKQLKENGGYCPWSLVRTDDTKCMFREFREMESGTCHCGLYVKTK